MARPFLAFAGRLAAALCILCLTSCAPNGPQESQLVALEHTHFSIRGRLETPTLRYSASASDSQVSEEQLLAACRSASAVWNATGLVQFLPADGEAADLRISFERDVHGACTPFGRSSILAHTGPCGPGNYVHVDAERDWLTDPTKLERILAHEFGHALGIGHSLDPVALMFTEDHVQRSTPMASDLAALHSLYGGGVDATSDLVLRAGACDSAGERITILRGVAPHDRTALAIFDTQGDESQELLVWRTDKAGHGDLTIYSFDEQLRVTESMGPLHGICPPGATIRFGVTEAGERLLVRIQPGGAAYALAFDAYGRIQPRSQAAFVLADLADADGDGQLDRPLRAESSTCPCYGDLNGDGQTESWIRPSKNESER